MPRCGAPAIMSDKRSTQQQPPSPPYFERRIEIPRMQGIGVALLALIPLAALFGAFGLRSDQAMGQGDGVSLEVHYPALLRYQMSLPLELRVRNTGTQPLSQLSARIDEKWLTRFSNAELTPQPRQVTDRYFEVTLPDVPAGEERRIVGSLQGNEYGRHLGTVSLAVGARVVARVDVRTIVLP